MYHPTVHCSLSYLIPSCPPVYTLNPYHHILSISIPLLHHVSLAFTYYSILPYHTPPYPTLNYFTLPLLKLDRNDSWQKRLVLLGQIDLPSGDKADTTRREWLMAEDLSTFRHQVVLVTRDFCPRPGVPDISASRRFGTKPLNTPRRFGTKTFRHQNISKQDGWMDWITYMYFNYIYYVRTFRFIYICVSMSYFWFRTRKCLGFFGADTSRFETSWCRNVLLLGPKRPGFLDNNRSLKIDSIRLRYLLSFSVLPSVVIIWLKYSKGKQGHNSKIL